MLAKQCPIVHISREFRKFRRTVWLYRVHDAIEPANISVYGSVSKISSRRQMFNRLTELGRVTLKPCVQHPRQDTPALQKMVADLLDSGEVPEDLATIDVSGISSAWSVRGLVRAAPLNPATASAGTTSGTGSSASDETIPAV